MSTKQADPRALVLEHYAQRRAAVRDQFGEYGDDPSYADYSTWLAARYAAMREVTDEECAALQALKESTQPAANPQPVEDPRERLLELAAEARAVGDHKAETAALVEVLKADRREVRGEKAEAVLVVLLRTYIDAAVLAEQPPAWVEIDAALVALLPASTKAERRELVAQAGYGIARNWTNGERRSTPPRRTASPRRRRPPASQVSITHTKTHVNLALKVNA